MVTSHVASASLVSLTAFGLTRGPDSNTTTYQDERQPRAVKLMRVRRATARGSDNVSSRKAGGFSPELACFVYPRAHTSRATTSQADVNEIASLLIRK